MRWNLSNAAARLAPLALALSAVGYLGLGAATGGRAWRDAETLPLLLLAGAGFGAGYSQVITRSIAGVAPEQAHDASGLFNTINMLGFALGVATLGSAFALVAVGCGALSLAGVGFVLALGRAEDAHARGLKASSASVRETAPVIAATTSSASG
jgi:hypothetical protein